MLIHWESDSVMEPTQDDRDSYQFRAIQALGKASGTDQNITLSEALSVAGEPAAKAVVVALSCNRLSGKNSFRRLSDIFCRAIQMHAELEMVVLLTYRDKKFPYKKYVSLITDLSLYSQSVQFAARMCVVGMNPNKTNSNAFDLRRLAYGRIAKVVESFYRYNEDMLRFAPRPAFPFVVAGIDQRRIAELEEYWGINQDSPAAGDEEQAGVSEHDESGGKAEVEAGTEGKAQGGAGEKDTAESAEEGGQETDKREEGVQHGQAALQAAAQGSDQDLAGKEDAAGHEQEDVQEAAPESGQVLVGEDEEVKPMAETDQENLLANEDGDGSIAASDEEKMDDEKYINEMLE